MHFIRLEHPARDMRHACRTIARMPLLATVVILSLGVGIGVNVVGLLVAAGGGPAAAARRAPMRGTSTSSSPRAETGTYPGASWLEYRDSANACARSRACWRSAWCR